MKVLSAAETLAQHNVKDMAELRDLLDTDKVEKEEEKEGEEGDKVQVAALL